MRLHQSVLLKETIAYLQVKEKGVYVDATLGRAGHAKLLLDSANDVYLYAFDKDAQALEESIEVLKEDLDRVTMIASDFRNMKEELCQRGVEKVDGILMDLGVSSPQFDDPKRGFSYRFDACLDMRMNQSQNLTAYQVVNHYSLEKLVHILKAYGEERYALPIAKAIVKKRATAPIETTFQLNDVVKSALPNRVVNAKGHPCKKTYQAIRIEVNQELDALRQGLSDACTLLKVHGRCCVISFHSLEDRIVKTIFKDLSTAPFVDSKLPILDSQMEQASFSLVTKHPILASEEEIENNHRAHSAKLRVLERVKE